MPNFYPNQHPYNYAQYTQPTYTPEYHAGQVSPNHQVPFPTHGSQLATPMPRPRHFSRNTHTTNDQLPYKSALKNGHMKTTLRTENGIPVNVPVPLRNSKSKRGREEVRGRNSEQTLPTVRNRNSSNSSRRADRSISRQRTNSKTRFIPGKSNPRTGISVKCLYRLRPDPQTTYLSPSRATTNCMYQTSLNTTRIDYRKLCCRCGQRAMI